jgi:hypothetical protein
MPRLIRRRDNRTETLTLLGADYAVTVTIEVRGLELDASTVEKLLHAPLTLLTRETL